LQGDEAIGPIPLKTVLVNWEVPQVLTREAQPLEMKVGVWWKVGDPRTYAFRISSRVYENDKSNRETMNRDEVAPPDWVRVLTESVVRSHVNRLGVADVVSAQATRFLRKQAKTGRVAALARLTAPSSPSWTTS